MRSTRTSSIPPLSKATLAALSQSSRPKSLPIRCRMLLCAPTVVNTVPYGECGYAGKSLAPRLGGSSGAPEGVHPRISQTMEESLKRDARLPPCLFPDNIFVVPAVDQGRHSALFVPSKQSPPFLTLDKEYVRGLRD